MIDDPVTTAERLPMMALRGLCVFPSMSVSFNVERRASIEAINAAAARDRRIFLVTQRDVMDEHPGREQLYDIGVICNLRQFVKKPEGGLHVMVEGLTRGRLLSMNAMSNRFRAEVQPIEESPAFAETSRQDARIRTAVELFRQYAEFVEGISPDTIMSLSQKNDAGYVADFIAQNVYVHYDKKQAVLEITEGWQRLDAITETLSKEIEVLNIEQEINFKLRDRLMHSQRDNVLREQMRILQSELGDDENSEIDRYRDSILALALSEDITNKLLKETDRLAKQPFGSAEGTVIRTYLDACLALPWHKSTKERLDINAARKILDRDHFGLEKVKERILEYLAVRQLTPDAKSGIICLVGPPGTGKTSVAISIADATNRKLARMSLGGVHDEAEIRGHRKTYVGAMPGRIMAAISQSGSNNPLLLLDEIDKLGSDYRGDPASALLEALDPEQNSTFRDNFLEIPFDLSNVLFITTANTTDTIPRPLLDRMEVIEISGYTDEEKLQIAKGHLLPRQRKRHGLNGRTLRVSDEALREMISGYTRESGVRQFERTLASVCRKAAVRIADGEKSVSVRGADLEKLLGPRRFLPERLSGKDEIGIVNGLAWTSVGGEMLEVEAVCLEGSGKLELTGNLGHVMQESAQAALTYIRNRCGALGIDPEFYKTRDIHVHFPEGAVPKDGPSAGITIAVAMISALTGTPVRCDIAMTGEITLSGRVLPIGGLKEKTMAALRYGVKTVLIPAENEQNLEEIDQTVRRSLNFITVRHMDDVIGAVFGALVSPGEGTDARADSAQSVAAAEDKPSVNSANCPVQ